MVAWEELSEASLDVVVADVSVSCTDGACASRAGRTPQNMIQWRLGVAFVESLHEPVDAGLRASLLMLKFMKDPITIKTQGDGTRRARDLRMTHSVERDSVTTGSGIQLPLFRVFTDQSTQDCEPLF